MMDQFEPWYFGVAFAFCFKYCTGMPDLRLFDQVKRHRRLADAPLVDLQLWSKLSLEDVKRPYRIHGIWASAFPICFSDRK